MKNIVAYPAVLELEDNTTDVYNVSFPDVPGALTYGTGLPESLSRASEALGLMIYDEKDLPTPSDISDIQKQYPNDIVTLVTSDLDEIKRTVKVVKVKKNTTLPIDIAEQAEAAGINFSDVLTEALKQKLGV